MCCNIYEKIRKKFLVISACVIICNVLAGKADDQKVGNEMFSLDDVSEITWAHAVNSVDELHESLSSNVTFLESDISMGHLIGQESGTAIPIMAHPPKITSDISFERWLDTIIVAASGKGVKLDFKTIAAVEPTLQVLKRHGDLVNFPLWLNADIISGPVKPQTPVPPQQFLRLCKDYFPNATLSLGWTTLFYDFFPPESWHYGWSHVREMADALRCFGISNDIHVSFPVRAILASRSIEQFQWLLDVFPESTLTVFSGKSDPVEVADLVKIRESFKVSEVYYDVPEPLMSDFRSVKSSHIPLVASPKEKSWLRLERGSQNVTCASYTYVNNETVVFGKDIKSAVFLKDVFQVSEGKRLQFEGIVEFFQSPEGDSSSNHELTLALVDVSLFSKDSIDVKHLNNDIEVLWNAIGQSELYVFKHNFKTSPNSCHYFKLDTESDSAFQSWTIPCDAFYDGADVAAVVEQHGHQEVQHNKRLALPPSNIMIGIMSTGGGHVVMHKIKIDGANPPFVLDHATSRSSLTAMLLFLSLLLIFI